MRLPFKPVFAVLCLALNTAYATQTKLIFPRLSFESGTVTGFAILNPTARSAVVEFKAYDGEGRLIQAPGFMNPRQITIEAGRQFAETATGFFGSRPPDAGEGWVEAVSEVEGLTGFFLYLDFPGFSFFDGADLPRLSRRLVFAEGKAGKKGHVIF